jgi:hypothetical protein
MPSPERRLRVLAAFGLGLILAVVVAAAGIRLGIAVGALRVVHRAAASLDLAVTLWLVWTAWRARASLPAVLRASILAIGLVGVLTVVGIAAGQNPPPVAAAANLLGGLGLVAVFAWILGELATGNRVLTPSLGVLVGLVLAIQLALGARLAIVARYAFALPVHGVLALVLAGIVGWVGLAQVRGGAGKVLFALALAAALAGFTSLHYEYSAVAALVHALAAAFLLAATAYALGRRA